MSKEVRRRRRFLASADAEEFVARVRNKRAREELAELVDKKLDLLKRCFVCGNVCKCTATNMFESCCNCIDGWVGTVAERTALAERGPSPSCDSCYVGVCNKCMVPARCGQCDGKLCGDFAICSLLLDGLCRACASARPNLEEEALARTPSPLLVEGSQETCSH